MRIPIPRRLRHPLYPALTTASAAAATKDIAALYGAIDELTTAGESGVRVERAVFPLRHAADPFLSGPERDLLWDTFQVPIYALVLDERRRVVAYECEAQDGLHLAGSQPDGFLPGRLESKLCECGRPGPRLMPDAAQEWQHRPLAGRLAG